ncbi:MAG: ComF family protein [Synechococcales bacterium]|nr:ComF family protein [Synechococcales bacterium]
MLHSWADSLIALFLKPTCPICQRSGQSPFCTPCDRTLQHQKIALGPILSADPPCDRIFAWGTYGGTLRQALHQLKYEGQPAIATRLGTLLAQAWLEQTRLEQAGRQQGRQSRLGLNSKFMPIVVPIPLSQERRRQRGYNQAELIARSFCQWTGYPCYPQGLIRQRDTQAQYQLGKDDRQCNLRGAFALGKSWQKHPPKQPILLLDDIYTTGTTMQTATQVLRQAGISVWGGAIVARTGSR